MSYDLINVRRRSDNKVFLDLINASCDVHHIFDGDILIDVDKEYNDIVGVNESSKYEEIDDTFELSKLSLEDYANLKQKLISLI